MDLNQLTAISPIDGRYRKQVQQLDEYFKNNCFPYEAGSKEEIMSYANFAASAQNTLELAILDFVRELKEKSSLDNLVIAGGVALNCSANGKIERSGLFKSSLSISVFPIS